MIKNLFNKYKEIISYLFFGVMTTLVNFVSFWAFNKILGESLYLISNVIAWVISVVFAYVTNKLWVFESKSWKFRVLLKEVPEFFAARVFSLCVEECGLWLLVDKLGFDKFSFSLFNFEVTGKLIAKVLLAVIVVITLSKEVNKKALSWCELCISRMLFFYLLNLWAILIREYSADFSFIFSTDFRILLTKFVIVV